MLNKNDRSMSFLPCQKLMDMCLIGPDVPVSQNTVGHGSKNYSPLEQKLKVHEMIFEEQMRIYNAKRLWVLKTL